jgi:CMP-N-acetylneuraminic acid synthetase
MTTRSSLKIVALIPMRHHSQRVPGKNYRLLAGKPLFHHIVETLLAVPEIAEIVIDTDSEPVMEGLSRHFPQVRVVPDFYLQTHSTNPLLKPETISRAIQLLITNYPNYDSLFSVTRLQTRLYDQHGRAINHDPAVLIQTQDLPPVYEENSCLYIFTRDNLVKRHHRIGETPLMFEIDAEEAWDIDEELDFAITDFLLRRKNQSEPL